jgi:hypothetical protein
MTGRRSMIACSKSRRNNPPFPDPAHSATAWAGYPTSRTVGTPKRLVIPLASFAITQRMCPHLGTSPADDRDRNGSEERPFCCPAPKVPIELRPRSTAARPPQMASLQQFGNAQRSKLPDRLRFLPAGAPIISVRELYSANRRAPQARLFDVGAAATPMIITSGHGAHSAHGASQDD